MDWAGRLLKNASINLFITILIECIFISALGAFMAVRNFAERVLTDIAHTWWMVGVAYVGKKLQEDKQL